MHRCLEISEVLRAIFDQLSRRTLASLARTCQGLRDPALDVLWHSQRSLLPLLKCLPPHIWEEIVKDGRRVLRIRQPITPNDWKRVHLYNYRVKDLKVESAELDVDFFRTLELSAPGPFLLPNLRVLAWTLEEDGFFPFCRQFLAPTLCNVTLVLQDYIDVPASTSSVRVVSHAICGWTGIKKLAVTTLDESALAHISRLPQLQDLQIQSHVPPIISEQRLAALIPPGQAFPALRHLVIGSETIQSAFSLVAHVSSPHLRHLHINTQQCAPAILWEESFRLLVRLPCRPSLTSLSLRQRFNSPLIPGIAVDKYILTPRTIAPLLNFRRLADIVLQPFFGLDLDDETVHQMAIAWPRLENLELGAERSTPRFPRTTLRALVYLTEHCPQLNSLQLALDATDPVPRFSRRRGTRPEHRLGYLHTGPSPVGTPAIVAAFLSDVFSAIVFGHRPDTDADRPWAEVGRLFQVFRSVRAEEARCWTGDNSDADDATDSDGSDDDESSDDDLDS
ncbi:hypothetical protein B0H17DRAFT_1336744 [Mycena rosella]|uniref:F-box domain-containing protein n=1 Tax=Mycena rosella TaxID=1033263 RepID=A0AAD7CV20_MYCRO|nr:hypothetical protein B0H17DRAFT_1336744 [Mycena rosella]